MEDTVIDSLCPLRFDAYTSTVSDTEESSSASYMLSYKHIGIVVAGCVNVLTYHTRYEHRKARCTRIDMYALLEEMLRSVAGLFAKSFSLQ